MQMSIDIYLKLAICLFESLLRKWIFAAIGLCVLCGVVRADWGTLEDFTGYTEVDPGNDITIAENTITATAFASRDSATYVYKDHGAAHFNGDFSHRFKLNVSQMDSTYGMLGGWALANSIGDLYALSPFIDFSAFTEVDPGADVTVVGNSISFTDWETRNSSTYVYYDYGANHFSGDFTHFFSFTVTTMDAIYGMVLPWGLWNAVGDTAALVGADEDGYYLAFYEPTAGNYEIRLRTVENGETSTDAWAGPALGTRYYVTVVRDDDGGANNTGQLTGYVCTGNFYGWTGAALQDTLTLDCGVGEQNDFRYYYALNGYNTASAGVTVDGTIQSSGIGESTDDAVFVQFSESSGTYSVALGLYENNLEQTDSWAAAALSTDYYITIARDDDGGANNTGQYNVYICTTNYQGEAGANLEDTLTLDCSVGEQNDFQYLYALQSLDTSTAGNDVTGTVDDMDIGEATAGGAQLIIIEMD